MSETLNSRRIPRWVFGNVVVTTSVGYSKYLRSGDRLKFVKLTQWDNIKALKESAASGDFDGICDIAFGWNKRGSAKKTWFEMEHGYDQGEYDQENGPYGDSWASTSSSSYVYVDSYPSMLSEEPEESEDEQVETPTTTGSQPFNSFWPLTELPNGPANNSP